MEQYFSESTWEGVKTLTTITQDIAYAIAGAVALFYYIGKFRELKEKQQSMFTVLPVLLKPTIIFFLIATYSGWTQILGDATHAIGDFIQYRYDELSADQRREFVDDSGNQVDPWLHYQQLASKIRNQKSNQMKDIAMSANTQLQQLREKEEKAREDGKTTEAEAYAQQYDQVNNSAMDQLHDLDDQTPSLIGEAIRNSVMTLFTWLVDGSYFIIVLVLEKVQEGLLAFCLAVGVFALLWSLIPGREGSFDTWLTYFFAIQFWSIVLIIINVFYNASIIGNIKEMEGLMQGMSEGRPTNTDFYEMTIDYVANCISYIILFIAVPGLIQIFISKSGGSEMFSRFISQAGAGTSAAKSFGGQAGGYIAKGGSAASGVIGKTLRKAKILQD